MNGCDAICSNRRMSTLDVNRSVANVHSLIGGHPEPCAGVPYGVRKRFGFAKCIVRGHDQVHKAVDP